MEWIFRAADQVEALARVDRDYQEFEQEQQKLSPMFEMLLEKLAEDERELILDYFQVRENMLWRKSQLAYEYGKQIGRERAQYLK